MAYLDMPLVMAEDHVPSSLCAIGTEPRSWTTDATALRNQSISGSSWLWRDFAAQLGSGFAITREPDHGTAVTPWLPRAGTATGSRGNPLGA